MKIKSITVQASTRPLRAKWTIEISDLRSKIRAEYRILKIKNIFKDDN